MFWREETKEKSHNYIEISKNKVIYKFMYYLESQK